MKMKKKSMFSKMLAVCLALVFALSMSVTAFAAITPDETGSFTVTGFDTDPAPSVSAYQIITVNVDATSGQPSYPMYTWNAEVATWMKANSYASYVNDNLGTNAVADAFDNADAGTMTTFLEKLTAAIKAGTVQLTPTTVTAADGTASFTDMAMGEYLITANGGVKIYKPTTVALVPEETEGEWNLADATVAMKGAAPSIGKEATEEVDGDKTVAIGDTVKYKLTVTVPSYPENATHTSFIVSDKLSAGLTFDGVSTIKVYSDENLQNEVAAANYTATTTGVVENRTFQISFEDTFTTTTTFTTLYITYTATVNEHAVETDALENEAFLTYNNDPYSDNTYETETQEEVYTYGIDLKKVDKDGTAITSGAGDKKAQFTLSDDTGVLKFTETATDGVYKYDENGTATLEVAADGTLRVQGLDEGTYTLKETQAPEGYVLPTGEITIVITDAAPEDGTIDAANVTAGQGTVAINGAAASLNVVSFNVENTSSDDAGFTLPTTGGMGTMIFTIAGVLLMAGAVTMIVVVSKKRKAE